MRDAFGGSFMLKVILVFIFIYVFFIAIALNYAKAFRIKNRVLDYLEANQINLYNKASVNTSKVSSDLSSILNEFSYSYNNVCSNVTLKDGSICVDGLVVTGNKGQTTNGVTYIYYDIDVLISYNLGFLKTLLSLSSESDDSDMSGYWTISGQTNEIVIG